MLFAIFRRPYRFFLIAGMLALLLCLLPIRADDAPQEKMGAAMPTPAPQDTPQMQGVPAGADVSERTAADCCLHETLFYAPCGHSVQRRGALPAQLTGLSRAALESEMEKAIPGAEITGFLSGEVDISRQIDVPCPLHWVLKGGEDGYLHIYQNRTGETLSLVRNTEVPTAHIAPQELQALLEGMIFDDVQSLEGYLESMSS